LREGIGGVEVGVNVASGCVGLGEGDPVAVATVCVEWITALVEAVDAV
jgi:hypothetical protein